MLRHFLNIVFLSAHSKTVLQFGIDFFPPFGLTSNRILFCRIESKHLIRITLIELSRQRRRLCKFCNIEQFQLSYRVKINRRIPNVTLTGTFRNGSKYRKPYLTNTSVAKTPTTFTNTKI